MPFRPVVVDARRSRADARRAPCSDRSAWLSLMNPMPSRLSAATRRASSGETCRRTYAKWLRCSPKRSSERLPFAGRAVAERLAQRCDRLPRRLRSRKARRRSSRRRRSWPARGRGGRGCRRASPGHFLVCAWCCRSARARRGRPRRPPADRRGATSMRDRPEAEQADGNDQATLRASARQSTGAPRRRATGEVSITGVRRPIWPAARPARRAR